jgi:hypothetical protein
MAYPPARSLSDELTQGTIDGRYRTGASDRGGLDAFTRPPKLPIRVEDPSDVDETYGV